MLFRILFYPLLLQFVGCFSQRQLSRKASHLLAYEEDTEIPSRRVVVFSILSLMTVQLQPSKPAFGMTMDKKTGIALPDPGEIEAAIPADWTKIDNPFEESGSSAKSMFARLDSKPDSIFYSDPRFVEHVDDNAVQLMTNYVSSVVSNGEAVLDLCSSWTTHLDGNKQKQFSRFSGLGMNAKELEANSALSDWIVQDLNAKPILPYGDNTFDTVLCQLSIDYLTSPLEVLKEAGRVLKPGGKIHILFSNRLFLSKAVGLWTGADDIDHAFYVGAYLAFSGGNFESIAAKDLSTRKGRDKQIAGDPLYVVTASKRR